MLALLSQISGISLRGRLMRSKKNTSVKLKLSGLVSVFFMMSACGATIERKAVSKKIGTNPAIGVQSVAEVGEIVAEHFDYDALHKHNSEGAFAEKFGSWESRCAGFWPFPAWCRDSGKLPTLTHSCPPSPGT